MIKTFIAAATTAAAIAIPATRLLVVPAIVYTPEPVHAEIYAETAETTHPEPVPIAPDPETISSKISRYAAKYDVSEGLMRSLVSCETGGTFDPEIQSGHRYKRDIPENGIRAGDRELSFGLAQIHLPAHPDVSIEEATDPDFALAFMARELAAGNRSMWTC